MTGKNTKNLEKKGKKEGKEIATVLFPDAKETVEDFIKKYPPRNLPKGAVVARFAPSPTGFLHIGGLFSATVSERLAHQSGGVFFLRIEDTDKKREIEDGVSGITNALERFGVKIDEGVKAGVKDESTDFGAYGPYKQSERKNIYIAFVKRLIETGNAYPCFCTPEELEASRKSQEAQKVRPGYYGEWAVHRKITLDEIKKNLAEGKHFAIRMRSVGGAGMASFSESKTNADNKIPFTDLIKGEVSVTENDQDTVLLKSDFLPTYHFAHVVDDFLMGTTHVLRGDEWLSSLPIHLELFAFFGFPIPHFGHISPILKSEGGNKRKLSKRKDPEAAVEYYLKEGYPNDSVLEYLLNIANSDFEDWRKQNPKASNSDFHIKLDKMNKSGALFDINKLTDISKDVIAKMTAEQVFDLSLAWANEYDKDFAKILEANKEYAIKIFGIERSSEKPRKDLSKWSEVRENFFYFFSDLFKDYAAKNKIVFPENLKNEIIKEVLASFAENQNLKDFSSAKNEAEWSLKLKDFAEKLGFAKDIKAYKLSPASFKGHIGDIAMILRVALTSKTKTPNLFDLTQTLGETEVIKRCQQF